MAVFVKFKRLRNIIDSIEEVGFMDLSQEDQDLIKLILSAVKNGTEVMVKK